METSLHRVLKHHYADDRNCLEVPLGEYRIDALAGDWLVEIQHGTLAAIRDKVAALLKSHQVLIVKPLLKSKQLIKRKKKDGRVIGRRKSPRRANWLDIFDELLYFTRVFPHPRLAIEFVMVDIEEWRYPGHGRRRRWSKKDFVIEDQKLVEIHDATRLQRLEDLWSPLGDLQLPRPFHTGHLAEQLGVCRNTAQRIAYVMRETAAIKQVGKQGNAILYNRSKKGTAKINKAKKKQKSRRRISLNPISEKIDPNKREPIELTINARSPAIVQGL